MILISSCLLGLNTKYNGKSNPNKLLIDYARLGKFIPVCPEQLGGLKTPRGASEIIAGSGEDVLNHCAKVMTQDGINETAEYIKGAEEVIKMLSIFPITAAILKQRSPSCGMGQIYDGTFSGTKIKGEGVTAALLRRHNIPVFTEEDIGVELIEKLLNL